MLQIANYDEAYEQILGDGKKNKLEKVLVKPDLNLVKKIMMPLTYVAKSIEEREQLQQPKLNITSSKSIRSATSIDRVQLDRKKSQYFRFDNGGSPKNSNQDNSSALKPSKNSKHELHSSSINASEQVDEAEIKEEKEKLTPKQLGLKHAFIKPRKTLTTIKIASRFSTRNDNKAPSIKDLHTSPVQKAQDLDAARTPSHRGDLATPLPTQPIAKLLTPSSTEPKFFVPSSHTRKSHLLPSPHHRDTLTTDLTQASYYTSFDDVQQNNEEEYLAQQPLANTRAATQRFIATKLNKSVRDRLQTFELFAFLPEEKTDQLFKKQLKVLRADRSVQGRVTYNEFWHPSLYHTTIKSSEMQRPREQFLNFCFKSKQAQGELNGETFRCKNTRHADQLLEARFRNAEREQKAQKFRFKKVTNKIKHEMVKMMMSKRGDRMEVEPTTLPNADKLIFGSADKSLGSLKRAASLNPAESKNTASYREKLQGVIEGLTQLHRETVRERR